MYILLISVFILYSIMFNAYYATVLSIHVLCSCNLQSIWTSMTQRLLTDLLVTANQICNLPTKSHHFATGNISLPYSSLNSLTFHESAKSRHQRFDRFDLWKRASGPWRASRPASEVQFSSPPGCSLAQWMPLQLKSSKVIVHEIRSHNSRLKTQRPQLHRKRFSCRSLSPWRKSLPAMRQPTELHDNSSMSISLPTWKYQTFLTNLASNLANKMADRVANKVASCVATKGDGTSLDWLWAV